VAVNTIRQLEAHQGTKTADPFKCRAMTPPEAHRFLEPAPSYNCICALHPPLLGLKSSAIKDGTLNLRLTISYLWCPLSYRSRLVCPFGSRSEKQRDLSRESPGRFIDLI
jgi:hypothetical protein